MRRRTPWEALDLGHAMFRAWSWPAYRAWLLTYWLAGLVIVGLMSPWPEYAALVLWWLKPLFDRVLLHVFSRSLFASESGLHDVLRELPRLLRGPGVLSSLTLRRFSMARSFLLPVWQLEDQRDGAARARFRLLSRRYRAYAAWLTFFCANMSSLLVVSILIVLAALTPGDAPFLPLEDWFGNDRSSAQQLLGNLVYMIAESIVEPLYVASGFSLYLNRRSELEAWDIEVGLRRLAERGLPPAAGRPSALAARVSLLAVALLCTAALLPAPLLAAEDATPPASGQGAAQCPAPDEDEAADEDEVPEDDAAPSTKVAPPTVSRDAPERSAAREAIDAVLADPVFGQLKEESIWRWRDDGAETDDSVQPWLKKLVEAFDFLADALRRLLWVVAGGVLAFLIYLVIRYRADHAAASAPQEGPASLFGFDLRPASLPADLATAARAALAADNAGEALSLLYRGALVALIERKGIGFLAADTEGDCLQRVAGQLDEPSERCFTEIVDAWRRVAYGRLPLGARQVEALIGGWQACFGARSGQT